MTLLAMTGARLVSEVSFSWLCCRPKDIAKQTSRDAAKTNMATTSFLFFTLPAAKEPKLIPPVAPASAIMVVVRPRDSSPSAILPEMTALVTPTARNNPAKSAVLAFSPWMVLIAELPQILIGSGMSLFLFDTSEIFFSFALVQREHGDQKSLQTLGQSCTGVSARTGGGRLRRPASGH